MNVEELRAQLRHRREAIRLLRDAWRAADMSRHFSSVALEAATDGKPSADDEHGAKVLMDDARKAVRELVDLLGLEGVAPAPRRRRKAAVLHA